MFRQLTAIAACAGVLSCTEAFEPVNVDPGLNVWAEVSPAMLSIKDANRPIEVRLNVRNPTGREMRISSGGPPYVFDRNPALSKGLWGSFRIGCPEAPLNCGPNTDWFGDSVFVLPARQTVADKATFTLKEWYDGGWPITVRVYHIRVWFNGREGASATLNIVP